MARPSADATVSSRKVLSLKLDGATLTVAAESQDGDGPVKTLQSCVCRRK